MRKPKVYFHKPFFVLWYIAKEYGQKQQSMYKKDDLKGQGQVSQRPAS